MFRSDLSQYSASSPESAGSCPGCESATGSSSAISSLRGGCGIAMQQMLMMYAADFLAVEVRPSHIAVNMFQHDLQCYVIMYGS